MGEIVFESNVKILNIFTGKIGNMYFCLTDLTFLTQVVLDTDIQAIFA